jgi:methylsterol monooxygenase
MRSAHFVCVVTVSAFIFAIAKASTAAQNATSKHASATWQGKLEELNSLNFLLPYWQYMLDNYSEFTINAGFTFVLHELVFFGGWAPYVLLDLIPYFQKYKIQQKPNTWEQTSKCLKLLMFNHVFVQLPMIISSDNTLKMLGFGMQAPLPSL